MEPAGDDNVNKREGEGKVRRLTRRQRYRPERGQLVGEHRVRMREEGGDRLSFGENRPFRSNELRLLP